MSQDDILDYFEDEFDENIRVVPVKYFYFESEARLYAARLKEVDIPSFISNANTASAIPLGAGGIGLHVREEDLEEASRIVNHLDYQKKSEAPQEEFYNADLDDIEYQKMLNENASGRSDWVYWLVIGIVCIVIIRAFLRATGIMSSLWDQF